MSAIKSIFSTSASSDVAIDIVRRVTNTDGMTDREKADYVLEYMRVTSGQSLARRVIAIGLFSVYVLFLFSWLGCFFFLSGESTDMMQAFITDILMTPFNLILSFYFVLDAAKKFGK